MIVTRYPPPPAVLYKPYPHHRHDHYRHDHRWHERHWHDDWARSSQADTRRAIRHHAI